MCKANHLLRSFIFESAIDRDPLIISSNSPLREAIPPLVAAFERGAETCILAIAGKQFVGLLTAADILNFIATGQPFEGVTVADAIDREAIALKESELQDMFALWNFWHQGIRHLPILDEMEQPIGTLHRDWILQKIDWKNFCENFHEMQNKTHKKSSAIASLMERIELLEAQNYQLMAQVCCVESHQNIFQQKLAESEPSDRLIPITTDSRQWQFQNFCENAIDLIQGFSLETERFLYVNRAWNETLGYEISEVARLGIEDILHPNSRQHFQKILTQLRSGQRQNAENLELELLAKQGSSTWVEANLHCQYQNGKPSSIWGIFRKKDPRQFREEKYKNSEKKLQAVLAGIDDIVLEIDVETQKIEVVTTTYATSGANAAADPIRKTVEEILNGCQSEWFWNQIRQAIAEEKTLQFEYNLNVAKRKQFSARVSPLTNKGVIWVARDISTCQETQTALLSSQTLLAGILNSSLDGVMAFESVRNSQGEIVDFKWLLVNATAAKLVGRSTKSLIGKHLLEEMPGNKKEGLFDLYVQVVTTGNTMNNEFYYEHEGISAWFENVAVKLGDGFTVTFRNITDIKLTQSALQQANKQLIAWVSELEQRNREMAALREINEFLQACLTVEEAYSAIAALVPTLFPNFSGGLCAIDRENNLVEVVATWGDLTSDKPKFEFHECWALRRGRPHYVERTEYSLFCDHIHPTPSASICLPMMAQGEISGLFYLISSEISEVSEAKQQLARTFSEQLALAIANIKLRESLQNRSIRDPLTGLFNRRYLEETLDRELHRCDRLQKPLAIVAIDIDRFKRFNDTFGHQAGDLVLQEVGRVLQNSIRGSDIACRYGGEELLLILPDTSLADACDRAEQIRYAIKQLHVVHHSEILGKISASFGVSSFPDSGQTPDALIRAADAALYRAKASGRDRVVSASPLAEC